MPHSSPSMNQPHHTKKCGFHFLFIFHLTSTTVHFQAAQELPNWFYDCTFSSSACQLLLEGQWCGPPSPMSAHKNNTVHVFNLLKIYLYGLPCLLVAFDVACFSVCPQSSSRGIDCHLYRPFVVVPIVLTDLSNEVFLCLPPTPSETAQSIELSRQHP